MNFDFIFVLLFVLNTHCVLADHIIGSEMHYTCLGEGADPEKRIYIVDYIVYSKCGEGYFGDPMPILFGFNEIFQEIEFEHLGNFEIPTTNYSCLAVPFGSCYQQVIFSTEIELDLVESDYLFVRYDCCRVETLSNVEPTALMGSTQYVTISPVAQENCNSSPTFNEIHPTSICNNSFFEISQAATDLDQDQLIYELCAPLMDPDFDDFFSFPPYPSVPFIFPEYGPLHPLGQYVLNLDSNTGTLSGTPNQLGSYLVGICVSEFRNGQYLSTTRRDIQLNVVPCELAVVANIEADEITPDNTYIINSCNNQSPTFVNLSTQEENITNLIWSFDMGNEIETSTEWSPTIHFEEPGSYQGNLILNPNGECTDTLDFVNVVADVVPEFIADYDTCTSGPIQFSNSSFSVGSELTVFEWSFGDGTFSNDFSPEKVYEGPGEFEINLKVIDEFNCMDSITEFINWQPVPTTIIMSPETVANCAPLTTIFNNMSWPFDSSYSITWDFGDGSVISNIMNPSHEFLQEGIYDIAISIESPIGCYVDTVFQELITVGAAPIANFNFTPSTLTQFDSTIELIDLSENAVNWRWYFDEHDSLWIQNPAFTFADTGLHTIKLIIEDLYGCSDTLIQIVDVLSEVTYFLPNAFSPNGDGVNDVFSGKGIISEMLEFELSIFDRWGGLLFYTNDPEFEWNGYQHQNGKIVGKGVYVYQLNYLTSRGQRFQDRGFINLIR